MNGQAMAKEGEPQEWTTPEEVALIEESADQNLKQHREMVASTEDFRAKHVGLLYRKASASVAALKKWGEDVRLINLKDATLDDLKDLLAWCAAALKLTGEVVEPVDVGMTDLAVADPLRPWEAQAVVPAIGGKPKKTPEIRWRPAPSPEVPTESEKVVEKVGSTRGAVRLQDAVCKVCQVKGHDRRSHMSHPARFSAAELARLAKRTGVPQTKI